MVQDKDRERALSATLSQLEKQFGKGSVLRLGSKDAAKRKWPMRCVECVTNRVTLIEPRHDDSDN